MRAVSDAPVGLVDSGVGGLTVVRSVLERLPRESVVYVGDTAHGPYGPQPLADVRAHALRVTDGLVDEGVKALVIACNSASAACLRDARERYAGRGVEVLEVVLPAARRAAQVTRSGRVGVVGTRATVASRAYDDALEAVPGVTVTSVACPRFVELVEAGVVDGPQALAAAQEALAPLRAAAVDTLVLGCTHYPLLGDVIGEVMGPDVALVSSGPATAQALAERLQARGLLRSPEHGPPRHEFRATGDVEPFRALGRRFLGPVVDGLPDVVATGPAPAPAGGAELVGASWS